MSWPQKEVITQAVVDMLKVNMSLKPGESLLVVTDVPRIIDWQTESRRDGRTSRTGSTDC
jgi:hypothetical protein